jgi:hypothetical protein
MEVKIGDWVVLMDEEDYKREFIAGRTWRVRAASTSKPYLQRRGARRVWFHRAVMNAQPGQQVDHINGNSLDNRKQNLRLVTPAQNCRNVGPRLGYSSRFKGVGFHLGRWRARIKVDNKHIEVGRFKDEVEAAFAYDIASLKYHGEYGRRNFLPLA